MHPDLLVNVHVQWLHELQWDSADHTQASVSASYSHFLPICIFRPQNRYSTHTHTHRGRERWRWRSALWALVISALFSGACLHSSCSLKQPHHFLSLCLSVSGLENEWQFSLRKWHNKNKEGKDKVKDRKRGMCWIMQTVKEWWKLWWGRTDGQRERCVLLSPSVTTASGERRTDGHMSTH